MKPSTPQIMMPAPPRQVAGDPELWDRIEKHNFNLPGATLTFTARLARENGWPETFAVRVVREYRRFVYLACIARQEVTPSDEVDQVWHLHLAYTRNYWEEFCPNVLRRPLHHGPTAGGPSEDARYRDNYRNTLSAYKAAFNLDPPVEIWPPEQIRFGHADEFVRANKAVFAVEPRPDRASTPLSKSAWSSVAALLGGILLLALLYQTGMAALAGTGNVIWPMGIVFALFILLPLFRLAIRRIRADIPRPGVSVVRYHQPQHGYIVNYIVPATGAPFIDVLKPAADGKKSSSGGSGCGGGGIAGCGSGCGGGGCGGGCGGG